jgi:hypothetical protein
VAPAPVLGFDDVLFEGLAADGGLYVPETWPTFELPDDGDYADVAAAVIRPFVTGSVIEPDLDRIVRDTYARFRHPDVAPLCDDSPTGHHLLELFWGPTLSFKDYALQFVGAAFDAVLAARGGSVTVLGATSGDTGSAAIEALRDRPAVQVVILYPEGRVSDVQRRQMTTVIGSNVHAIAVDGTFDDCQATGEGCVLRRPASSSAPLGGGQLDQLGPGDGPGGVLRLDGHQVFGSRSTWRCPPATSATSSRQRSPGGEGCRSSASWWGRTPTTVSSTSSSRAE